MIMYSEEAVLRLAHAQGRAARLDRHITFVGFMGAGKSTMARLTARQLGRASFDTDQLISKRNGCSVTDFFTSGEEPLFRRFEREVIAELLDAEPAVLSLGGGALEDPQTRSSVFKRTFVVNLAVSWREVQAELPMLKQTRPLLSDRSEGEILELFLRRQRTYRHAHLRIQTPRGDPAVAVQRVLAVLAR